MNNHREGNYDLLRVASMAAVVAIHVTNYWIYWIQIGFDNHLNNYFFVSYILNSLSNFAVPCFLMLSGAFILDNRKNANYAYFYKKSFIKIGVPMIIFSLLYFLYRVWVGESVKTVLFDLISGEPMSHMWYLYMLIGVYVLAPMAIIVKENVDKRFFNSFSIVLLLWASISWWSTENTRLKWSIGYSFEYMGYFLVGYVLRTCIKKNTGKGIFLILVGCFIEVASAIAQIYCNHILLTYDWMLSFIGSYCPNITLASALIFAGCSMCTIGENRTIKKLAELSFGVYLIHPGVIEVLNKILYRSGGPAYYKDVINLGGMVGYMLVVLLFSIIMSSIFNCFFIRIKPYLVNLL